MRERRTKDKTLAERYWSALIADLIVSVARHSRLSVRCRRCGFLGDVGEAWKAAGVLKRLLDNAEGAGVSVRVGALMVRVVEEVRREMRLKRRRTVARPARRQCRSKTEAKAAGR